MIRPLRQAIKINGATYTVIGRTVQELPKYDLLDHNQRAYINIPAKVIDMAVEEDDDKPLQPYYKNTAE